MIETLFTVIVVGLACWGILDLWFHGSIFAGMRAHVDLWDNWAGQLLRCPLCLSVWVSGALVLMLYLRLTLPVVLVAGAKLGHAVYVMWTDSRRQAEAGNRPQVVYEASGGSDDPEADSKAQTAYSEPEQQDEDTLTQHSPSVWATVYSDDRTNTARFNAAQWFAQAPDSSIRELAKCGWGGDYPADNVATYMATHNPKVADVLTYISTIKVQPNGDTMGFECHVDEQDARRWLSAHRPELLGQIDSSQPEHEDK